MTMLLGVSITVYLTIMFGIALWSQSKIKDEEDYIVAGRKMPMLLTSATLLATWFGAGTLLTATDEIYRDGLHVTALEPYGAGLCLLIAGLFFAKPLWEMKVCTISDIYKNKFGPRAEAWSVMLTVPGYIGWIAVQLAALSGIIQIFFGVPTTISIPAVALIAMAYTLLGGMWSVSITDAAQIILVVAGMLMLSFNVFTGLGGGVAAGIEKALAAANPKDLVLIPHESAAEFMGWLSVLAVAAIGNLPGQDLGQRIFSAKSSRTAQHACYLAGFLYIVLGTIPVLLGIAAKSILPPDVTHSVLPALARAYLSPAATVMFMLALLSVVLSTIDSAILAPAATLARNALRPYVPARISTIILCQYCVVLVTAASAALALSGEKTYKLLEESYAIGLVGLFVPFFICVFSKRHDETAALISMAVGTAIWLLSFALDTTLPMDLIAVSAGFAAYYLAANWRRNKA